MVRYDFDFSAWPVDFDAKALLSGSVDCIKVSVTVKLLSLSLSCLCHGL